jgi:hypothetical protein
MDRRRKSPYISRIIVSGGGGGSSTITVQDEGTVISNSVQTLNFIGADVQALGSGSLVSIYIPPPTFASHFNTTDGTTTGTVSENISRSTAFISTPTSEGTPFSTGGWAASNRAATLSTSVTFTTGGDVTGFGGNSSMTVTVYDADGTTALETRTTPSITGDGSYGSGNITITISNYGADTTRFKARPTITVAIGTILTAIGRSGGRYHVEISMTTDSTTDGTGPYTYTQSDVFIDTNPTTPSIGGTTTIGETGGSVTTKHLSGIEYYTTGSQFTVDVTDIDDFNENTARTSSNLTVDFTNYGINDVTQSPLSGGSGSGFFTGWTSAFDNINVSYSRNNFSISSSNFRFRGTNATVRARVSDTWANSSYVTSSNASILIDTYGTTSSNQTENFTDEARRQDSGFNSGATSGNWNSTTTLAAGEAAVFGGQLIVPSAATLTNGTSQADYSSFKPDAGGANPNYTTLGAPASYYRTIVDNGASTSRAGFTIVFSGNFVSNATTDLANSDLEIFISRIASSTGGKTGPTNPDFLNIHGAVYNFATFDDGTTNGQIRESSSSGNTVNCTFGGFDCQDGFYMHIRINNTAIKISSLTVSFA